MISARRRKNTVRESRMEMHRVTWCDVVIVTMVTTMVIIIGATMVTVVTMVMTMVTTMVITMGATMVTVMTMKLTFSPESAGR